MSVLEGSDSLVEKGEVTLVPILLLLQFMKASLEFDLQFLHLLVVAPRVDLLHGFYFLEFSELGFQPNS
jgi:hypothetical protein